MTISCTGLALPSTAPVEMTTAVMLTTALARLQERKERKKQLRLGVTPGPIKRNYTEKCTQNPKLLKMPVNVTLLIPIKRHSPAQGAISSSALAQLSHEFITFSNQLHNTGAQGNVRNLPSPESTGHQEQSARS